jgi:hypothetical protein
VQYPFDPISLSVLGKLSEYSSFQNASFFESLGIPLLAEDEQIEFFYKRVLYVLSFVPQPQLVFLFVNEKEDSSLQVKESNKRVLDFFSFEKHEVLKVCSHENHLIVIINGTLSEWTLKNKEGVGRARRILGDITLYLYKQKKLNTALHRQIDADVRLPLDYFKTQLNQPFVAGTYPFFHSRGALSEYEFRGLQEYEGFLRSYVEGLKFADSPYAFWALGSTLIFDLRAYEKIRGFPNVQAGEDFYFLSKIQSQGLVTQIDEISCHAELDIKLEIVGRKSTRVPFGTGRALERLENGGRYEKYPHEVFEKLKNVLYELERLSEHRNVEEFFLQIPAHDHLNLKELKKSFTGIFKQKATSRHYLRQLHQTFDGLQTFRWVREKTYFQSLAEKSLANSSA